MTMYHNTMSALEKALTVGLIATDLKLNAGMFLKSRKLEDVLKYGKENRYSCIPLCKEVEKSDPQYWVTEIVVIDLAGKNESLTRDINPEDLISVETPIIDAIELLNTRNESPFFLVLEKNRITKILTASDLEKLPVRVLISTLLAHLEGLLQTVIEIRFGECDSNGKHGWETSLSTARMTAVNDLFRIKVNCDRDTRKIQCTSLTDKFEIILKSDLYKLINKSDQSKKSAKKSIDKIKNIRNRTLHNMTLMTTEIETLRDNISHNNTFTCDLSGLSQVIVDIKNWIDILNDYEEAGCR